MAQPEPAKGTPGVDISSHMLAEEPFTVYTSRQKLLIVILVSVAAFFSPLTSNIYYGAINELARDLGVSPNAVNFSFMSYMIAQGLTPIFVAEITESVGRRPAYVLCFVVFMAANIGLALQNNLGALIALRAVQAAGSSGTSVLANAVIADITTTAERGSYMGYTFAGAFVGQSVGPLVGGILAQFRGWRAIFWFLTIFAGVFSILLTLFLPETSRKLVGNGSRSPRGINKNLLDVILVKSKTHQPEQLQMLPRPPLRFPNPFAVLRLFGEFETAIILLYAGLLFAGLAVIAVAVPSLFEQRYHYNSLQIGLSFIPSGVGGCLAAFFGGKMADYNYRRHATRLGVPIDRKKLVDLDQFPIERARIEVVFPLAMIAIAAAIAYGWVVQYTISIAGPLVFLFLIGFASAGAFNVMSTLLLDIQMKAAAKASACNNVARCLLGAGGSVIATPMVQGVGSGWSYTIVGCVWLALQPAALYLASCGPKLRRNTRR